METVRKTYQEQLRPTPQQERALEAVLWRCRTLDTVAREPRLAWGRRGQGSGATRCQQEAALKEVRAAFPEYTAIQSHSLQDVLARLDKTAQAFFRRRAAGEKAGLPRFPGRDRSHSFTYHSVTYKAYGNGAHREHGSLVLSTRGRLAVRWSRPRKGTPKTGTVSNEADGGSGSCSCADVPTEPLPETGRETGIAVGHGVPHHRTGSGRRPSASRPEGGAGACPGAAAGLAPPAGQSAPPAGRAAAGAAAPTRPPAACRLAPHDGARPRA
ncbi:MAG TPA: hypothetical protein VGS80_20420, partial [Ktedonobacterales bacterium]|nr:hypothetical protein [Ktedonobacterales bacterium]